MHSTVHLPPTCTTSLTHQAVSTATSVCRRSRMAPTQKQAPSPANTVCPHLTQDCINKSQTPSQQSQVPAKFTSAVTGPDLGATHATQDTLLQCHSCRQQQTSVAPPTPPSWCAHCLDATSYIQIYRGYQGPQGSPLSEPHKGSAGQKGHRKQCALHVACGWLFFYNCTAG